MLSDVASFIFSHFIFRPIIGILVTLLILVAVGAANRYWDQEVHPATKDAVYAKLRKLKLVRDDANIKSAGEIELQALVASANSSRSRSKVSGQPRRLSGIPSSSSASTPTAAAWASLLLTVQHAVGKGHRHTTSGQGEAKDGGTRRPSSAARPAAARAAASRCPTPRTLAILACTGTGMGIGALTAAAYMSGSLDQGRLGAAAGGIQAAVADSGRQCLATLGRVVARAGVVWRDATRAIQAHAQAGRVGVGVVGSGARWMGAGMPPIEAVLVAAILCLWAAIECWRAWCRRGWGRGRGARPGQGGGGGGGTGKTTTTRSALPVPAATTSSAPPTTPAGGTQRPSLALLSPATLPSLPPTPTATPLLPTPQAPSLAAYVGLVSSASREGPSRPSTGGAGGAGRLAHRMALVASIAQDSGLPWASPQMKALREQLGLPGDCSPPPP